jgi:hypothetical protein
MAQAKILEILPVFLCFLPVPCAKSIGVSDDKQLISVSLKNRLLYYWAKMAARQLASGDSYENFDKIAVIVLSDFNFIEDSDNYYHRYVLYDKEDGSQFTDLIDFVIVELSGVPAKSDHTAKWGWAKHRGTGPHRPVSFGFAPWLHQMTSP